MDLWICDTCGAVVKTNQVRGRCAVCGKRLCTVCAVACECCCKSVCPECIRLREVWRRDKLHFMKICDACWKKLIW